jgi:hypothetical protein
MDPESHSIALRISRVAIDSLPGLAAEIRRCHVRDGHAESIADDPYATGVPFPSGTWIAWAPDLSRFTLKSCE